MTFLDYEYMKHGSVQPAPEVLSQAAILHSKHNRFI